MSIRKLSVASILDAICRVIRGAMPDKNSNKLSAMSLMVIATIAVGWFLQVGSGVLIPILLGALTAILLESMTKSARRIPVIGPKLPYGVRLVIAIVITFLLMMVAMGLISRNLDQVVRAMPSYTEALSSFLTNTANWFGYEIVVTWQAIQKMLFSSIDIQTAIRYGISSVSYSIGYVFLVFIYALFFLLEGAFFDRKLSLIFKNADTESRLRSLIAEIIEKIGAYVTLKTMVNVVLGLACWLALVLFGIDFAAFWAILTGLFNYIPYVGSLIAVLLPVIVSIGQYESIETTTALMICLIVIQNVIGFVWEPRLFGRGLNLSPLVIIVSLAAWTAIWGIAGAILSVPLTAIIVIVLGSFERTRPVAILMSRNGAIETPAGSEANQV